MEKKAVVHYLVDGEYTACKALFSGAKEITTFLSDATCKKCLKVAQESSEEDMNKKTVTLYTLAPPTLDRAGTESVGSYWLYKDDKVPEQALREVVMPESSHVAQHQAYTLKTPYITYTEVGLGKALAKGIVYRSDEQVEMLKPAIMAAIDEYDNNQKEVQTMPAKKPLNKAQKAAQEKLDDLYGKKDPAQEKECIEKIGQEVSALDAILAQPIVAAAVVKENSEPFPEPVDMEDTALATSLSMQPVGTMPVDLKALAQEIIAALKAEGLVMVTPGIMPPVVEPEIVKDPDIWDILGDGTGPSTPMVPAKPRSTLKVFTNKAAEKTVRASSGKTDLAIVKAIQQAWRSGKVTQESLAQKYGMDSKKVWYFCNRAKQL